MGSGAWVYLGLDNQKLVLVQAKASLAIKLDKTLTDYILGSFIAQ